MKSHGNEGKPDPDKGGRDQYKRHIDGDITVRGQIEAHVPPSAAEQHTAEREEDKRRAKKNYIVGVLTLVAVVIYAGIAAWQGWLTRSVVQIAQKTYDASQRPYVGIKGISGVFMAPNKKGGPPIITPQATKDSIVFAFTIQIVNFGPVTGSHYVGRKKVIFGGVEKAAEPPELPATIFPTESLGMKGVIDGEEYKQMMRGDKVLAIDIKFSYDGPSRHYTYCEKTEYQPNPNQFAAISSQEDCP